MRRLVPNKTSQYAWAKDFILATTCWKPWQRRSRADDSDTDMGGIGLAIVDNGREPAFGNNLSGDKQRGPNRRERV